MCLIQQSYRTKENSAQFLSEGLELKATNIL